MRQRPIQKKQLLEESATKPARVSQTLRPSRALVPSELVEALTIFDLATEKAMMSNTNAMRETVVAREAKKEVQHVLENSRM